MNIKEVSYLLEIPRDTLLYYETIGLLGQIEKDEAGKRCYHQKNIEDLKFIKLMREAGIEICVIKKYIDLNGQENSLAEKKIILTKMINVLMDKQQQLQRIIDILNHEMGNG